MKILNQTNSCINTNFSSYPPSRKLAIEVYQKLDKNIIEYAKTEGLTKSAILDILQNENLNRIQEPNVMQQISSRLTNKLKSLVVALKENADRNTLKKKFKLTKLTSKHLYNQFAKVKRNSDIIKMYKESKDKEKVAKEFNVCVGTIDLITRKGKAFQELIKERDSSIAEMLDKKMPSKEIAEKLGLSRCMVQRTAKKLGKDLKHGGNRNKTKIES